MSDAARRKCYAEITEIVKAAMGRYVAEFPERTDDERHIDAIAWSMRGINRIFRVLDQFELTEKKPPSSDQPGG